MNQALSRPALLRLSLLAAAVFAGVGLWALRLQARQARDIIRKHDIEDIETALVRYSRTSGTIPPDDTITWCGRLSDAANTDIRARIESALREDEKYARPEKPFPADPTFAGSARDYFYWKTSPVSFELLAELEADPTDARDTRPCGGTTAYDYSVVSTLRNPF